MVRATLSAVVLTATIGFAPPTATSVHAAGTDDGISDPELQAAITEAINGPGDEAATVAVEVLTSDDAQIERTVRALGGRVTGSVEGEVVQAIIPASQVGTLANAADVDFVQAPRSAGHLPDTQRRTEANIGTGTPGNEVAITNADAWHTADFIGTGVHVGIVDYFDMSLWNVAEQGPKPTVGNGRVFCQDTLNVGLCTGSGGIVNIPDGLHGVAVAEIVKDMAPAADLYIATVGSVSDLRAAVDWFAANGVTIITRSLGSAYDGPGDGTGPLDAVVDYAAGKKITWFNSAGNDAVDNYMKRTVTTLIQDGASKYVDFDSGAGTDTWLRLDGGTILMDGIRWANDWYLATAQKTDYSVEFWEPKSTASANLSDQHWHPTAADVIKIDIDGNNSNAVNNVTNASQSTGAAPLEAADLLVNPVNSYGLGGVAFMRIKYVSGPLPTGSAADTLEIALGRGLTELGYSNKPGSAAKPVVDSKNPGLLAVGAIEPAAGSAIASYSSQGPTSDGRIKPDISAPSGLTSTIYSPSAFSGTSASAPTAAGAAALLLGAGLAAPGSLPALVRHLAATYGDLGAVGPDNLFGVGELLLPDPPALAPSDRSRYVPLTVPARALDTRSTSHVGPAELVGPYAAQAIIEMPMLGAGGVPASGVTAVAINLTSVGSTVSGYVQAAPFLVGAIGGTSTLNIVSGTVRPNFAVVPLGVDGKISIFIQSGGNVIVDVLGYYVDNPGTATEGRFVPLTTPERWMDTRGKPGIPLPAAFGGTPRRLNTLERVVVPVPVSSTIDLAEVDALVVTLTAVDGLAGGYLRAMPTGTVNPLHSNVNFVAGTGVANTSIVPLADDGTIELQANVAVNAIVDVVGYITSSTAGPATFGLFKPITPGRAVDTRLPTPNTIAGGTSRTFALTGLSSPVVAANAVGVSVNATAVFPVAAGWLKVYPGPAEPPTSNVNYLAGDVVATGTFVRLNAGSVIAKMFQTGHVIIDVNGYFLP